MWVRRDYEDLVRTAVAGVAQDQVVIGQLATRRNVTTDVINNAEHAGDVPEINASRLRTTWLAWLCTRPVPVSVILQAAGLKGARTLSDVVRYLPTDSDTRTDLRGPEVTS